VSERHIRLDFSQGNGKKKSLNIPWAPKPKGVASVRFPSPVECNNHKLLKSLVRAHGWLADLTSGAHSSVEDLATAASLHPKVIRQGLRLAFLSPELTSAAIEGNAAVVLKQIPKVLPFSWREHEQTLR
jgi:hypothetical protein